MAIPPSDSNNPYSAPSANLVETLQQDGRRFVPEGISVGTDAVLSWYSRGFDLFKAAPGIWIANVIILFIIICVLSVIPLLGPISLNFLIPVFAGGLLLGCAAQARNGPITIDHLFAGFKSHFGPLAIVGALYLAGFVILGIVVAIIAMVVIGGAGMAAMGGMMMGKGVSGAIMASGIGLSMVLAFLVWLAISIPLVMAVWFAPCLVVMHNMAPVEAMKASFSGCLKNVFPFLVYGILYLIFAFVASIPLLLGWLVLGPVVIASIYFSYTDIYLSK
jgi:uncharacterized membrane protein